VSSIVSLSRSGSLRGEVVSSADSLSRRIVSIVVSAVGGSTGGVN